MYQFFEIHKYYTILILRPSHILSNVRSITLEQHLPKRLIVLQLDYSSQLPIIGIAINCWHTYATVLGCSSFILGHSAKQLAVNHISVIFEGCFDWPFRMTYKIIPQFTSAYLVHSVDLGFEITSLIVGWMQKLHIV